VELATIIAVIAIALAFDYTNGFHDAANAIATSISTRALTPRVALLLAAVMNFVGAFLGTKVAQTVFSVLEPPAGEHALVVIFAALGGAITWNLITWSLGLPSSSSHALIGGLVGAGLAGGVAVHWKSVVDKVVIPMLLSPLVGGLLAFLLMLSVLWIFKNRKPAKTHRGFRLAQTLSASAMALGHGLQDAQKTMGVIVLALVTGGYQDDFSIPWWVVVLAASAISLGTYSGGWRIMRTLGRRIIKVDPPTGFVAESSASAILYTAAYIFEAPISTTQTITGAIMGAGAVRGHRAVRWGVAGNILTAWVLTIPMSALVAAVVYYVVHFILE
jgi:PiT family inorganic phosphate transporter